MIEEIKKEKLNFRNTIFLSHTILAIWNSTGVENNKYTQRIIELATYLAEKYPEERYKETLLKYIDHLLELKCHKTKEFHTQELPVAVSTIKIFPAIKAKFKLKRHIPKISDLPKMISLSKTSGFHKE